MQKTLFLGIDIGGTKIAAGLVDAKGNIMGRDKCPTPQGGQAKDILSSLVKLVRGILAENGLRIRDIAGVGVGIPGIVESETGNILLTPNIHLSGCNIAQKLKNKLRIPVAAGNDVNLGTLGEKWVGAGRNAHTLIGLFPGTGVGGGIIIGGKLYDWGAASGELGHMTMDINGPKCTCGNKGCLEAIVGRWAIERDIRKAIKKGEKTVITKISGKKFTVIKSKLLKKALKKKDPLVTGIMKRTAKTLGLACVSLRHILNPDVIILGGGIMEACGDFILPRVQKVVRNDAFFKKAKIRTIEIRESQLGDDAVVIGAACLIKQRLKK
ncbi:MAG: ROK family protein [Candidatus Omnitrophica bacterium]|nr:ROK family protein [Candidatus Omnitrophota bacterium]